MRPPDKQDARPLEGEPGAESYQGSDRPLPDSTPVTIRKALLAATDRAERLIALDRWRSDLEPRIAKAQLRTDCWFPHGQFAELLEELQAFLNCRHALEGDAT
jgi:hypothetical protein